MHRLSFPLNRQSDSVEFLGQLLDLLEDGCGINELFEIKSYMKSTCFMGEHGDGSSFRNTVDDSENILTVKVPFQIKSLQEVVEEELTKTSSDQFCRACEKINYFTDNKEFEQHLTRLSMSTISRDDQENFKVSKI